MRTLALSLLLVTSLARADSTVPPSLPRGSWAARCWLEVTTGVQAYARQSTPVGPTLHELRRGDRWSIAPSKTPLPDDVTGVGVQLSDDQRGKWIARAERSVEPVDDDAEPPADSGWKPAVDGRGRERIVIRGGVTTRLWVAVPPGDDGAFGAVMRPALDGCVDASRAPAAPSKGDASFAGRWALSGAPARDTCGGRVVLAARHIDVSADETTLVADVVNRTYAAQKKDGALLASGDFTRQGGPTLEYWSLHRQGDALVGTLKSSWKLPSGPFVQSCTVTFELRATRAR